MRTHTEKEAKQSYLPPYVELTEILVEKGFAASINNNTSSLKAAEWTDGTEDLTWDQF